MRKALVNSIIFSFVSIFIFPIIVNARTIYVGPNESYKTIKDGIWAMSGGDTLIIRNGTYVGKQNMMSSDSGWEWNGIPNGSASQYTTIKAESDYGVVIDGQGLNTPLWISGRSYIKFEGLLIKNSGGNSVANFHVLYSDHIKILRCAAYEPKVFNFYVQRSKYCLVEDSFAWGKARYHFIVGGEWGNHGVAKYNIFRRCVARFDKAESASENGGCFTNYSAGPNYLQNVISIDGLNPETMDRVMKPFYGANGSTGIVVDSSIALNNVNGKSYFESASSGTVLRNTIIWKNRAGVQWYTPPSNIVVENSTFGDLGNNGDTEWNGWGFVFNIEDRAQSVKNNIFFDIEDVALIKSDSGVDYNVFYSNGSNYSATNKGPNDISDINVLNNGLLYLPKIESGSYLEKAGKGGGRIGAQILKKLGESGTLYGEVGWNTLTNENLWPFPNEDVIRSKMRTYNLHGANGKRGFCADGETLTKYIWEYLGNPIPPDIYGGIIDPPPSNPPPSDPPPSDPPPSDPPSSDPPSAPENLRVVSY